MLKLGMIGFGGGSAMIPVFEKELVQNRKVLDEDTFLRHTVIANVTPGGLPTKLAALSGFDVAGTAGAILSAVAAGLPGTLLAVAIIGWFGVLRADALRWVEYAGVGISAYIVLLLIEYVARVWRTAGAARTGVVAVTLTVFALTGANPALVTLGHLVGRGIEPRLPAVGSLEVIVGALFLIAIGTAVRRPTPLPHAPREVDHERIRRYLRAGAAFTVVTLATVALSAAVAGAPGGALMGLIALSMLATFGGGPAYIAVADGFFVGSWVEADVFYSQLVPVANATPGPLITKLAAAVAFHHGMANVSLPAAVVLALGGLVVAAGVSGAVAMVVTGGQERIAGAGYIRRLQRWVVPVICGLLVTTAFSMTLAAVAVGGRAGIAPTPMAWVFTVLVAALLWLHPRVRLPDVVWIAAVGALTLAGLGLRG